MAKVSEREIERRLQIFLKDPHSESGYGGLFGVDSIGWWYGDLDLREQLRSRFNRAELESLRGAEEEIMPEGR